MLKKTIDGSINNVITSRLYKYKPVRFRICKISVSELVLYAHKFQGNPENSFALKKSENAKLPEKKNSDKKFNFKYGPINSVVKAVNKLKNKGIKIRANGIKILKFSSNVSEFVIHEIPLI